MSISEPLHMSEPVRRIEVFTGAGRRRQWSADEKSAIVAESYGEGETVCAVARRHGLTPQQLFTWRRLARRVPGHDPLFVPALVEPVSKPDRIRSTQAIEVEIEGAVIRIGPDASARTIVAVIRALQAGA